MKILFDYFELKENFASKIRRSSLCSEHIEEGLRKGLLSISINRQKGGAQLKRMT